MTIETCMYTEHVKRQPTNQEHGDDTQCRNISAETNKPPAMSLSSLYNHFFHSVDRTFPSRVSKAYTYQMRQSILLLMGKTE